MNVRPLNRNILVELIKIEKTASGILLTTSNDARMERGKILAIDSEVDSLSVGDVIYFKLYALSSVDYENNEFHFLKADDVLGVEE